MVYVVVRPWNRVMDWCIRIRCHGIVGDGSRNDWSLAGISCGDVMGGSVWGVTLLEVDVVNTRDSALFLGGLSKNRIELFGKVAENDRLNEGLLRVKLF